MNRLVGGITWIMLASGALTCTMVYAAVAPQAALHATFRRGPRGPVAEIVVHNWGALIALVGGMLIFGAFHPASRSLALVVASLSKIWFITLLLVFGRPFLSGQAGVAFVGDPIQVARSSSPTSCRPAVRQRSSRGKPVPGRTQPTRLEFALHPSRFHVAGRVAWPDESERQR